MVLATPTYKNLLATEATAAPLSVIRLRSLTVLRSEEEGIDLTNQVFC